MSKYHLISTFDYEIFGDGTGCLDHCLLRPMNQGLEAAESVGSPQTLFIDLLEFASLRLASQSNHPLAAHYPEVEQQICSLNGRGHNIQWHIHPQWLDAKPTDDGWQLDFSKWRIANLSPADIARCFEDALEYANALGLFKHNNNGQIFRAGGWSIQPSNTVLSELIERGIFIDSTVAPGVKNWSSGDWFNYAKAPKHLPFWHIDGDVCSPVQQGALIEVPIATHNIGRVAHFKALKETRAHPGLPCGCHGTYHGPNNKVQDILGKVGKVINMGTVMLDISTLPSWALIKATEGYMERFANSDAPVPIVCIGHNKNFTDRSADNFKRYLEWLDQHSDIQFSDYLTWHAAAFEESPFFAATDNAHHDSTDISRAC